MLTEPLHTNRVKKNKHLLYIIYFEDMKYTYIKIWASLELISEEVCSTI